MIDNIYQEFTKLEKLNAQVDVWIDDENYSQINNSLNSDGSADDIIKSINGYSNTHDEKPDVDFCRPCFPEAAFRWLPVTLL